MSTRKITQEKLRKYLLYDHDTGTLTNKISRKYSKKNAIPGCLSTSGYIVIRLFGKLYQAHNLVWLYIHGYFPEHEIDHIDRNRSNNRLSNLREVSHQCNMRNVGIRKNNTSGITGVMWFKPIGKWTAHIRNGGQKKGLGYYSDFNNAVCARLAAEQCLDWAGCDSNTPAFLYVENMFGRKIILQNKEKTIFRPKTKMERLLYLLKTV